MKFKVIEGDIASVFEQELNEFASRKDIEVIEIQYSTSGLAPDTEAGWNATILHNALIKYIEFGN